MSDPPPPAEPGRRSLLVTLAAFGALALLGSAASFVAGGRPKPGSSTSPPPAPQETPDPRLLAYLGPLAEGRPFGGARITRVDPVRQGGVVLEIAGASGAPLAVDLRARSSSAPAGIAETKRVAIYLRTGRAGAATTEEAQRACVDLAAALSAREAEGHEPPALEPLAPSPPR